VLCSPSILEISTSYMGIIGETRLNELKLFYFIYSYVDHLFVDFGKTWESHAHYSNSFRISISVICNCIEMFYFLESVDKEEGISI